MNKFSWYYTNKGVKVILKIALLVSAWSYCVFISGRLYVMLVVFCAVQGVY